MLDDIIKNSNKDLEGIFTKIDEIEEYNSSKVLDAFIRNSISESDFNSTTGYGYNDISDDNKEKIINDVIGFTEYIENYKLDTLIYTKKLWHNNFKDRNYNIIGINLMIYFYYDVIRYKSGMKILFFNDYEDNIIKIANMNDIDVLCDKIKVLNDTLNNIKYNLNINLLIDKLVIDMCGDNS